MFENESMYKFQHRHFEGNNYCYVQNFQKWIYYYVAFTYKKSIQVSSVRSVEKVSSVFKISLGLKNTTRLARSMIEPLELTFSTDWSSYAHQWQGSYRTEMCIFSRIYLQIFKSQILTHYPLSHGADFQHHFYIA